MYRLIPWIGGVIVSLTMTGVASATNYIWLEAEPLTGGAIVVEDGMGHALDLKCDPCFQNGDAECRWLVTIRIGSDDPLFGWTLDLGSRDVNTAILSAGYLTPIYGSTGALIEYFPFDGPLTFVPGSGPQLMRRMGAGTIFAVPPAIESDDGIAWNVAEFILSKTATSADSGVVEIYGRTGVGAYGPVPGETFPAVVGDNPEIEIEQPLTIYPNALITISTRIGADYVPPAEGEMTPFLWDDEPIVDPADAGTPGDSMCGGTGAFGVSASGFSGPSQGGTVGGIAISEGGRSVRDPMGGLTALCAPTSLMSSAMTLLCMMSLRTARRRRR
ncbi:MAG TPA: hypothetical protein P5081_07465 [Phycisphaerae bacterium]|nr:hypothetical protein [Phycisphaerae bacterium]HRW52709.1 hypothetical protein [Phycisphaerae bacterium]